jgi:membrane protein DedA with SNARE-associated domain
VEDIVYALQNLDPLLLYAAVFAIAFIENLFPPFPSDVAVVFGGSLAGMGYAGAIEVLAASTLGSSVGFVAMYKIGEWFGRRVLERGKLKFVSPDALRKVEEWFGRYGYWLIVANRFLAGTRAVISFFAGISRLRLGRTFALSFLSALVWNSALVAAGYSLGKNWERVTYYLGAYSQAVTALLLLAAVVILVRTLSKRNKSAGPR